MLALKLGVSALALQQYDQLSRGDNLADTSSAVKSRPIRVQLSSVSPIGEAFTSSMDAIMHPSSTRWPLTSCAAEGRWCQVMLHAYAATFEVGARKEVENGKEV